MRAKYKIGFTGLVAFCLFGAAACGNSDSTSSAGAESADQTAASAVASEEEVYVLPENNGLLFEDVAAAPVAFDAPVTTIPEVKVSTTFVENYTTTSEVTTTTAPTTTSSEPTFVINVAPESDVTSGQASISSSTSTIDENVIEIGEVASDEPLRRLLRPANCLSTKLKVDNLVEPFDDPANDEVYKRFVYDAFWACLYRPVDVIPDDDGWLMRLKETAAQEFVTVAHLEAVAADMLVRGIHPSREASCMRGTYECSPELDLKNAEGQPIPIECAFAKGQAGYEKIQVSHENAKLRMQSLCPDAELDIEVVVPAVPVPVEKPPAAPKVNRPGGGTAAEKTTTTTNPRVPMRDHRSGVLGTQTIPDHRSGLKGSSSESKKKSSLTIGPVFEKPATTKPFRFYDYQ